VVISRSSVDSEDSEDSEKVTAGPGRRLRDARRARNLELEEVAARLHLHVSTIKQIEADDYDSLPAPTFVRGYLRGYARMLDIVPETILADYNSQNFGPPPLMRDISNTQEVRSTDISFRLATYLIVTVVVILVALWWQNQNTGNTPTDTADINGPTFVTQFDAGSDAQNAPNDSTASETPFAPSDAANATSSSLAAGSEQSALDLEAGGELGDGTDEIVATIAGEQSTGTGAETTDAIGADTVESTSFAQEQSVTQDVVQAAAFETGSESDAGSTGNTPAVIVTADGTNSVRITVGAETWLEIYDHDNEKLFYDLAKTGSVIEFSQSGQFRLLLGNTSDVAVEFNGVAFNIAPHTDAGVARFSGPPGN